jgi:hypothetical protein
MVRNDFDLCSACESKAIQPFPMLKIPVSQGLPHFKHYEDPHFERHASHENFFKRRAKGNRGNRWQETRCFYAGKESQGTSSKCNQTNKVNHEPSFENDLEKEVLEAAEKDILNCDVEFDVKSSFKTNASNPNEKKKETKDAKDGESQSKSGKGDRFIRNAVKTKLAEMGFKDDLNLFPIIDSVLDPTFLFNNNKDNKNGSDKEGERKDGNFEDGLQDVISALLSKIL